MRLIRCHGGSGVQFITILPICTYVSLVSSVYLLIYLPCMIYFARYDRLFAFSDIFTLGVLQLPTARPVKISLCCRIIVRGESSNSITRPICPPFLPSPSRCFILEIKDIRIIHVPSKIRASNVN